MIFSDSVRVLELSNYRRVPGANDYKITPNLKRSSSTAGRSRVSQPKKSRNLTIRLTDHSRDKSGFLNNGGSRSMWSLVNGDLDRRRPAIARVAVSL